MEATRNNTRKEIQVLFQHQGHRSVLKCKRSNLLENVQKTLLDLGGLPHSSSSEPAADTEVHMLQSNRKAAVRRKPADMYKSYYLLQRYVEEWSTFVNVDSIEQVKTRDTLTVEKTVGLLTKPPETSTEPKVASYSQSSCM